MIQRRKKLKDGSQFASMVALIEVILTGVTRDAVHFRGASELLYFAPQHGCWYTLLRLQEFGSSIPE
jgi:hypothetical protein